MLHQKEAKVKSNDDNAYSFLFYSCTVGIKKVNRLCNATIHLQRAVDLLRIRRRNIEPYLRHNRITIVTTVAKKYACSMKMRISPSHTQTEAKPFPPNANHAYS